MRPAGWPHRCRAGTREMGRHAGSDGPWCLPQPPRSRQAMVRCSRLPDFCRREVSRSWIRRRLSWSAAPTPTASQSGEGLHGPLAPVQTDGPLGPGAFHAPHLGRGVAASMGWPLVAQAAAGGARLASVAAKPRQVPGGVLGPDIGFGGQHRFLLVMRRGARSGRTRRRGQPPRTGRTRPPSAGSGLPGTGSSRRPAARREARRLPGRLRAHATSRQRERRAVLAMGRRLLRLPECP
jgi:hypothetical protein